MNSARARRRTTSASPPSGVYVCVIERVSYAACLGCGVSAFALVCRYGTRKFYCGFDRPCVVYILASKVKLTWTVC